MVHAFSAPIKCSVAVLTGVTVKFNVQASIKINTHTEISISLRGIEFLGLRIFDIWDPVSLLAVVCTSCFKNLQICD